MKTAHTDGKENRSRNLSEKEGCITCLNIQIRHKYVLDSDKVKLFLDPFP